jgi:uncharacterized protein
MKLHASAPTHLNVFTGYGEGFVMVNQQQQTGSVVVGPTVLQPWAPAAFADLSAEHFAALLAHAPEVVLLGTGGRLQFPHPHLTRPLIEAGIGVEAMDVSALCRTFNILVAEDRRVLAAVLHR